MQKMLKRIRELPTLVKLSPLALLGCGGYRPSPTHYEERTGEISVYRARMEDEWYDNGTFRRILHLTAKDSTTYPFALTGHDSDRNGDFPVVYWQPTRKNGYNKLELSERTVKMDSSFSHYDHKLYTTPTFEEWLEMQDLLSMTSEELRKKTPTIDWNPGEKFGERSGE